MITRRDLLAGTAAFAATSALPAGTALAAGGLSGAIRWDYPWYGAASFDAAPAENSLGPKVWQSRAPWFSTPLNDWQIAINGNQQSYLDLELQAAHASGLKYWAYDWYTTSSGVPDPTYGRMNAWRLHQSSAYANLMNWCIAGAWSSPSDVTNMTSQFVTYFQMSNYQKVLGNRPLIYVFYQSLTSAWAAPIAALRAACATAGVGSPFIVLMNMNGNITYASYLAGLASTAGMDALSWYAYFFTGTYAELTAKIATSWVDFAAASSAAGLKFIPSWPTGEDTRPQMQNPPSWSGSNNGVYIGMLNFTVPPTVAERVTLAQNAIDFVAANPTVCPAGFLICAWDECSEEGSALIPTLGDPPAAAPPYMNSILTALSAVLP